MKQQWKNEKIQDTEGICDLWTVARPLHKTTRYYEHFVQFKTIMTLI